MKRILYLLVTISMILSFASCQENEAKISCKECGTSILQSYNFCSNCGVNLKISDANETSAQTENNALNKDEMLKIAETVDIKTLDSSRKNMAKAKQDYCDKVIKVLGGIVQEIEEDHVVLLSEIKSNPYGTSYSYSEADKTIIVYLSADELASLNFTDEITVIGLMTTNFEEIKYGTIYSQTESIKVFIMENAYLVH